MAHQLGASSSGANSNGLNGEIHTIKEKGFPCKFCKQKFSTSQALGGHQNAHKKERSLEKFRQQLDASCFGLSHFPSYSSYPTLHEGLYRSFMDDSLNLRPSNPWTTSIGFRYDQRSPYFNVIGNIRSHHAIPSTTRLENHHNETLALFPNVTTNVASQVMNTTSTSGSRDGGEILELFPNVTTNVASRAPIPSNPRFMPEETSEVLATGARNLLNVINVGYSGFNQKGETSDIDLSLRLGFKS